MASKWKSVVLLFILVHFNMKLLKLLFLSLLLVVSVHAEQRAVVIRSCYTIGHDITNLKELSVLLLEGWTVDSVTRGSGNDSMSYWLVILKK